MKDPSPMMAALFFGFAAAACGTPAPGPVEAGGPPSAPVAPVAPAEPERPDAPEPTAAESSTPPTAAPAEAGGNEAEAAWRAATSEDGTIAVEWRPLPGKIPVNDYFQLEVRLYRVTDGVRTPWEGAVLGVRATMPAHRHGMLTQAEPEDLGGGLYHVPSMLFHMEGHWVLHLSVRTGERPTDVERLDFDLDV